MARIKTESTPRWGRVPAQFSLDTLTYQDATIDILALGCRGLCKDSFPPIEMPYVQFLLDPHFLREGNEAMPVTEPSREPSAEDPNFCTRSNPYLPHYRLAVRLPEDRRFMPGKLLSAPRLLLVVPFLQ
jgi:hypothetical protein